MDIAIVNHFPDGVLPQTLQLAPDLLVVLLHTAILYSSLDTLSCNIWSVMVMMLPWQYYTYTNDFIGKDSSYRQTINQAFESKIELLVA